MIENQKVLCIDSDFDPEFRRKTKRCPIKGNTYIIRRVLLAYENTDLDTATVALLLWGIFNDKDEEGREPAFSHHRFLPMEEKEPHSYDRKV